MSRVISVERGTTRRARLVLEVGPDHCELSDCGGPIDFSVVIEAQAPYDADPPFEGIMPLPAILDADPDDEASIDELFGVYCGAVGAIDCFAEASNDGMIFAPQVPAEPGEIVYFRVTVQNVGDRDIDSFSMIDFLPPGLTDIAIIDGPGCAVVRNSVDCPNLGSLPEGAQRTILYQAVVDAPVGTRLATFVSVEGRFPSGDPVTSECLAAVDVE